jgi:hypothetical protein
MKSKILPGLITAAMLLTGASNVWADDAKIDCSTASDDIATLQGEKEKVKKHKSKGLFSYTPIGMIAGAVSGSDEKSDSSDMQVDEYNKKLDEKIAEINAACGGDSQ